MAWLLGTSQGSAVRAKHTRWRGAVVARLNQLMIADVTGDHPLLVQFRQDPYPLYQYLLSAAPVQFNDLLGAWTVARYADVAFVLTDSRFSAERPIQASEGTTIARSMLVSDPPNHTRLRTLVQKAFTPRMI